MLYASGFCFSALSRTQTKPPTKSEESSTSRIRSRRKLSGPCGKKTSGARSPRSVAEKTARERLAHHGTAPLGRWQCYYESALTKQRSAAVEQYTNARRNSAADRWSKSVVQREKAVGHVCLCLFTWNLPTHRDLGIKRVGIARSSSCEVRRVVNFRKRARHACVLGGGV